MVNLIADIPIWRSPSIFINAAEWEHCIFGCEVVRCGNIYYSNSILITNFVYTFMTIPYKLIFC
jgi:hypothetical protein